MSVLTTGTTVVVGLGNDASTIPGTTVFWAPALTTLTSTYHSVQGLGSDASTLQTSFDTITIADPAEYASLTAAAAKASAITSDNETSAATSRGALSLEAKVGIGVGIPLFVIVAAIFAIDCFRRRRWSRRYTSQPQSGSLVDTTGAGTVRRSLRLPTSNRAWWPPELHSMSIVEANPNASRPKNRNTRRTPVAANTASRSQNGSEQPLPPSYSYIDPALHTTATQSTEAALAQEADAAIQELGLLATRKRTLIAQANAVGRRPEDVQGRKGEEYRELVVWEQNVTRRLDDIEAERRGTEDP